MTAFRKLLSHRCTIQTFTAGEADAGGHVTGSWGNTYTSVVCRFYGFQAGRETIQEKEARIADFCLALLPAQSISENDRVTGVVDRDGTAIPPDGTYEVTNVRPATTASGKLSHQTAFLKLVR